jgi:hypothetical protein
MLANEDQKPDTVDEPITGGNWIPHTNPDEFAASMVKFFANL